MPGSEPSEKGPNDRTGGYRPRADASAALWSKDLVAGHTWMNPVDDLVFAMALAEFDIEFQLSGNFHAIVLDILERIVTIDVGLALSQQIEVRTIKNVDKAAHDVS